MESVPEFLLLSIENGEVEDELRVRAQSDSYQFSQSEEGLLWALSFLDFYKNSSEQQQIGVKLPTIALSIINNWLTNYYDTISPEVKGNIKEILFNHQNAAFANEFFCKLFSKTQSLFVIASITEEWNDFFTEFLTVEPSEGKSKEILLFLEEFLSEIQTTYNVDIVEFLEEYSQDEIILSYILNNMDFSQKETLIILNQCLSFMPESFLCEEAILTKLGECMSEKVLQMNVFDCLNTMLERNISEEVKNSIASTLATPEIIQEILSGISQESEEDGDVDEESMLYTLSQTVYSLAKMSIESYSEIILEIYSNGHLSSIEAMSELILQIVSLIIEGGGEIEPYLEPTLLSLFKYYEDDEFYDEEFVETTKKIMIRVLNAGNGVESSNIELLVQFFSAVTQELEDDENLIAFITTITDFILSFVNSSSEKTQIAAAFLPIVSTFFFVLEQRPPFEQQLIYHIINNISAYLVYCNEVEELDISPIFEHLFILASSGLSDISPKILEIIRKYNGRLAYFESFLELGTSTTDFVLSRCVSEALSLSKDSFQNGSFESCFGVFFERAKVENVIEFDDEALNNTMVFNSFLEGSSKEMLSLVMESVAEYFQQISSAVLEQENSEDFVETLLSKDSIRCLYVKSLYHCLDVAGIDILMALFDVSLNDPLTMNVFCEIFSLVGLENETLKANIGKIVANIIETFNNISTCIIEVDETKYCSQMAISFFNFCTKDVFNILDEESKNIIVEFCNDILKNEYRNKDLFIRALSYFIDLLEVTEIQPEILNQVAFDSWKLLYNSEFKPREDIQTSQEIIKFHSLLLFSDSGLSEAAAPSVAEGLNDFRMEKDPEEYFSILRSFAEDATEENLEAIIMFYSSISDEQFRL